MFINIEDALNILDKIFIKAENDGEFDGSQFQTLVNECVKQFPNEKQYCLEHYKNFVNCGLADDKNEYGFVCFAEAIVSIYKDINDLPLLLSYFDDSKEPEWAFDSLMIIVAKYLDPEYTESLLDHLSVLLPHAVEWASYLLGRIFNSGKKSHKIVWNHLHKCPKGSLKTVLENMLKDEGWEHLFPYIRFLLKELDKKE